jgi:DNA-directed RNA polymerase specialized sigma24 family protein
LLTTLCKAAMPDLSAKPNRTPLVRSAALEALSERFRPALLRYFRRRVSDASAEDLVQEVFLRMLRRRNVASVEEARGYLFETASSVLTDRNRRPETRHQAEHEERGSDAVLELAEHTPTIASIVRRHRLQALAAAIAAVCLATLAIFCCFKLKH